jgi:hypothetical protein
MIATQILTFRRPVVIHRRSGLLCSGQRPPWDVPEPTVPSEEAFSWHYEAREAREVLPGLPEGLGRPWDGLPGPPGSPPAFNKSQIPAQARPRSHFAVGTSPEDFAQTVISGIPRCFFGQVFFWRPGVPRPERHAFSRNAWFLGLAAFGGKAKKPFVPGTCVFFWP